VHTTTSADGTVIALERAGAGPPVVIVGGALSTRHTEAGLAALLAPHFTVSTYDRRGRGDSGDTAPYSVEREVDDLRAVMAETGVPACVYGTSAGGNLALEAAAAGLPISRLALWEPNVLVDDSRPPLAPDYVARLDELVANGRRVDAVAYFMTEAVGLPPEFVGPMREAPMWAAMEDVAHTLAYDGTVVSGFELPAQRMKEVQAPTLVLAGGQTPWLSSGARAVADALPYGQHRSLDGQPHNVDPGAIAPVLVEFLGAGT
jgi:pimeloyl-ACP methyl ester carboxylesterase